MEVGPHTVDTMLKAGWCYEYHYLINSYSPSGGMKLMLRSDSNLLSLTHWRRGEGRGGKGRGGEGRGGKGREGEGRGGEGRGGEGRGGEGGGERIGLTIP